MRPVILRIATSVAVAFFATVFPACAQSVGDTAAASAIALTPASTFVTMNPAIFGEPTRSALAFNLAHKPSWRTYGGSVNIGAFRLTLGTSEFESPFRERHFFVGGDYARRLLDVRLLAPLHFLVGGDVSFGYGARDFGRAQGVVAKTAGVFLAEALRFSWKRSSISPYFAPGVFWGRYTRVYGDDQSGKAGWRMTQGGGLHAELADGLGFEMAVRKTRIGEAIPRYGFGVWYRAAPLPVSVPSEVRNLKVEMDNDFYAFWIPPNRRPDEDYTNGLRVSFDRTHAFRGFGFLARDPACSNARNAAPCTITRIEIGQEIYTPQVDSLHYLNHDRPYAGWLYATYKAPRVTRDGESTISLSVGVVGPPSMADKVQKAFHALFPWYHRNTGWDRQLKFEPGVIAGFSQRRLLLLDLLPSEVVQVVPEWTLAAGNVRDAATAGLGIRLGYHVPHPWLDSGEQSSWWSIYLSGKAREDLVLHNIFLDGNTFDSHSQVKRNPFVNQRETGAGLRIGLVTAEYRAVIRQREYTSRERGDLACPIGYDACVPPSPIRIPASHPYGTLSVSLAKAF